MENKQNKPTAEINREEILKRIKADRLKVLNSLEDFDKSLIEFIQKEKPIIYVIFRGVSRSGMLRRFSAFMIKNNEPYYLNNLIKQVTGIKTDSEGFIKMRGCGMDMAFKMVADFSEDIFNDYQILNYRLI